MSLHSKFYLFELPNFLPIIALTFQFSYCSLNISFHVSSINTSITNSFHPFYEIILSLFIYKGYIV